MTLRSAIKYLWSLAVQHRHALYVAAAAGVAHLPPAWQAYVSGAAVVLSGLVNRGKGGEKSPPSPECPDKVERPADPLPSKPVPPPPPPPAEDDVKPAQPPACPFTGAHVTQWVIPAWAAEGWPPKSKPKPAKKKRNRK